MGNRALFIDWIVFFNNTIFCPVLFVLISLCVPHQLVSLWDLTQTEFPNTGEAYFFVFMDMSERA